MRRIRVDDADYFYSVSHQHGPREPSGLGERCRDVLTLRCGSPRGAALRLVFEPGPGRVVGDGLNPTGTHLRWREDQYPRVPPGTVLATGACIALNLHRPGVARAFLDEALARWWDGITATEIDGWSLFDAVRARLRDDEVISES